jgi:hypothetical protein
MIRYNIAPKMLKKAMIMIQINCMFPSNLLRMTSTMAISGRRIMPNSTNRIITNSAGPIIPKSVINYDLMVSVF